MNLILKSILVIALVFNVSAFANEINTNLPPSSITQETQPSGQELQLFYQRPTFSKFIQLTSAIANEAQAKRLLLTFATMVIDAHPDFVNEISKNFLSYSLQEKELLYTSLAASGNKNAIAFIKKKYAYTININSPYTASTIKNIKIADNPDNLDLTWAAFFATGNNLYLEKIIQYINEDDFILVVAYETLNRKFLCQAMTKLGNSSCQDKSNVADIIASIHKQYPKNYQQMLNKVATCASALWSLESNRHQDPIVDKKITEIIQENPNLDYWKKINQAIG